MASILKAEEREFRDHTGRVGNFGVMYEIAREKLGLVPDNLNFDLIKLAPGRYSSPYHFHRYAEELFMIISGSATLRMPKGLTEVESGDLIFFEKGEKGAHQLYNHTDEICTYLDIRTYLGYDVCEYPDSDKLMLIPSMELMRKDPALKYFDGEENVREKWEKIQADKNEE